MFFIKLIKVGVSPSLECATVVGTTRNYPITSPVIELTLLNSVGGYAIETRASGLVFSRMSGLKNTENMRNDQNEV